MSLIPYFYTNLINHLVARDFLVKLDKSNEKFNSHFSFRHLGQMTCSQVNWSTAFPPLSDLDGFSDFSGIWVSILVKSLGALPVDDMVLLSDMICYCWFVVFSVGFFSVSSGKFARGYTFGVLLVFFKAPNQRGAAAFNRDDSAFHLDHVYNPLLEVTTTSLPGYNVNKFRRKSSGPVHLWTSHLTEMTKAKVWVKLFIGFVKLNQKIMLSTILQNEAIHGNLVVHFNKNVLKMKMR